MRISKKQLHKMGWLFSSKEGEFAFIELINKTLTTSKKKKEFLTLFNQSIDKINGKRIYKNKIV